jgi:hypothetical protein
MSELLPRSKTTERQLGKINMLDSAILPRESGELDLATAIQELRSKLPITSILQDFDLGKEPQIESREINQHATNVERAFEQAASLSRYRLDVINVAKQMLDSKPSTLKKLANRVIRGVTGNDAFRINPFAGLPWLNAMNFVEIPLTQTGEVMAWIEKYNQSYGQGVIMRRKIGKEISTDKFWEVNLLGAKDQAKVILDELIKLDKAQNYFSELFLKLNEKENKDITDIYLRFIAGIIEDLEDILRDTDLELSSHYEESKHKIASKIRETRLEAVEKDKVEKRQNSDLFISLDIFTAIQKAKQPNKALLLEVLDSKFKLVYSDDTEGDETSGWSVLNVSDKSHKIEDFRRSKSKIKNQTPELEGGKFSGKQQKSKLRLRKIDTKQLKFRLQQMSQIARLTNASNFKLSVIDVPVPYEQKTQTTLRSA